MRTSWILPAVVTAVLSLANGGIGYGQDIQVSKANRTVEVTVTATVRVDPELAVIEVGYNNYARTREEAFQENVQEANRITAALIDDGIPKDATETEHLRLERNEPDLKLPAETRAKLQFQAGQSWHVRAPVSKAQEVVDVAVRAGANDVEAIEWTVRDPDALNDKAGAAALTKARDLAKQLVISMGAKLGELLYASNTFRRPKYWPFSGLETETAEVSVSGTRPKEPKLRLFPQQVERDATVHAIFAIE